MRSSEIFEILEDEAAALKSSDFDGLAKALERKEKLLKAGLLHHLDRQTLDLRKLEASARVNGLQLSAAAQGFRSAISKIQDIKNATASLRVYQADGMFSEDGKRDIEKKF